MNAHLVNLTSVHLLQLEALLADTTPGGGLYRPPVARDVWVLRDLEHAHLCRFTVDCGYEITDAGREVVVDHAMAVAAADLADGVSESTGRHRFVPPDDRPTGVLPRVQQQTPVDDGFAPSSGTLPGLPVVESDGIPADPDPDATIRLIAAIRATPDPEELAEMAAAQTETAGWDALAADLGDQRSWLRRKLRPHRAVVLAVVVSVVVTWGIAWLVLG